MEPLPTSILLVVATLTIFLCFITGVKYGVQNKFIRRRIIMTSFFFFIVTTLSVSFWPYALATLPFTIPAALIGALIGHLVGVRTAQEKLSAQGAAHYMEHFAHIHISEFRALTWWSVINFYSIMGALVLINLVGLSTVIFSQAQEWAIATSVVGAFLLGTIAPYLVHLWSINTTHKSNTTISEKKNS